MMLCCVLSSLSATRNSFPPSMAFCSFQGFFDTTPGHLQIFVRFADLVVLALASLYFWIVAPGDPFFPFTNASMSSRYFVWGDSRGRLTFPFYPRLASPFPQPIPFQFFFRSLVEQSPLPSFLLCHSSTLPPRTLVRELLVSYIRTHFVVMSFAFILGASSSLSLCVRPFISSLVFWTCHHVRFSLVCFLGLFFSSRAGTNTIHS